jgi:dienelactone hydrolase
VTELATRSLHYSHAGTELIGYLVAWPETKRPGVLLIHDALGVSEQMKAIAQRIAELGYTVLLADLWGDGKVPAGVDEIGPLIGQLASNRELWTGRVKAGHEQLLAQEQVAGGPVTAVGYCFGGSSVLEYVRVGGGLDGAVSFHGGLDLVGTDWSAANADASVLILTGAEDPMAPQDVVDALQQSMSVAGVDWEVASYGATKHGFTDPHADKAGRPDVIAYNARADRRSWNAFTLFLQEQLERAGVRA